MSLRLDKTDPLVGNMKSTRSKGDVISRLHFVANGGECGGNKLERSDHSVYLLFDSVADEE